MFKSLSNFYSYIHWTTEDTTSAYKPSPPSVLRSLQLQQSNARKLDGPTY